MCTSFDKEKIFILFALRMSLDHVLFGISTFGNIYPKLLFPWQPNIEGKRSIDILNEYILEQNGMF